MEIKATITPPRDDYTLAGTELSCYDLAVELAEALSLCLEGVSPSDYFEYLREMLAAGDCLPPGWDYDASTYSLSYQDEDGGLCEFETNLGESAVVPSIGHASDWIPVASGGSAQFRTLAGQALPFYLSVHDDFASSECKYRLRVPRRIDLDQVVAVALQLTHTRTRILSIRVLNQGQQVIDYLPIGFDPHIWFIPVQPTSRPVRLAIQFVGDPPVVSSHSVVTNRIGATASPPRGLPLEIKVGDLADVADKRSHVLEVVRPLARTREDEWDLRAEWCTRDGGTSASQAAHAMFLRLDRESQSLAGDDAARSERIGAMLSGRYKSRGFFVAKLKENGEEIVPLESIEPWVPDDTLVTDLAVLGSQVYSWLCVDEAGSKRSRSKVREYFEMFANGEATAFDSHGAPNGINMFCFAELAFLLAELELREDLEIVDDEGFWLEMARCFSMSCEMFLRAYHRRGAPGFVCAYQVPNNRILYKGADGMSDVDVEPERALSAADRDAIHGKWAGSFASEREELDAIRTRFGLLVYHALRAEFDGRRHDPIEAIGVMPNLT